MKNRYVVYHVKKKKYKSYVEYLHFAKYMIKLENNPEAINQR